jgi:predicted ATP-dependent serine protease
MSLTEILTEPNRSSIGIIEKPMDFYDIEKDDRPKPPDMIEGILPPETICGIVSDPGIGKTILAMNLCIHLSAGKDWCGHTIDKSYKTLYVLAEGGYWSLRDRVKKMSDYSIKPEENAFMLFPVRPYDLMTDDYAQFEKLLEDYSPDVFVIDTFIKCHDNEENDNRAMQRVMDKIRDMITSKNRSAFICHHLSKGGLSRGATAIKGDLDTVLRLSRINNTSTDRKLEFEKIRHGADIDPKVLSLNDDTLIFESTERSVFEDEFMELYRKLESGRGYSVEQLIELYPKSRSTFYKYKLQDLCNSRLRLDGNLYYLQD